MEYTKVRDVKSPIRGTSLAAGIDFFVPEFDEQFVEDYENKNLNGRSSVVKKSVFNEATHLSLEPHERVLIPSGVHVKLPHGYALVAHNKSGVATKKGLDRLAEVVDEDYQGEVHISVVNTSNQMVDIFPGEKLMQFLLVNVGYHEPVEVSSLEELYPEETERGDGGFGSTGQ